MHSNELPVLPFDAFGPKLNDLLIYTGNKLEREFPRDVYHRYSGTTLLALVLVSANTYRTMLFFSADKPADSKPKIEYSLSAAPLARTILDALFTVLFLLEDLNTRTPWFMKAGWRDVIEELHRAKTHHGADQRWAPYIEGLEHFAESSKVGDFEITPADEADPKKIKHWPIPNKMIPQAKNEEIKAFMEYLRDWFYRDFSQDTHLSWRGLARRAGYLLLDRAPEQKLWDIEKQKSDILGATVVLLLSMMSEIELFFEFGARERLKFVWNIINPYFQQGQEIYELRYVNRL
jgi:hypothetical protein